MSSEHAIEVSGLGKCYKIYPSPRERLLQMLSRSRRQNVREFWALQDVSFTIGRGETTGIIGRNGSGKSTLLQMICGTVSPTVGTVSVGGRIAALLELGAGFNTEFTGRENVLMNAAILGFPQQTMAERMEEVIAFSELGDYIDQPVKTYSSGMYARLAFSIAIHVDPEILIVDEALSVGDARFTAKCMRRIKDIQMDGASILFVSHDVGAVRTLCARAIWLDSGRLVESGDVFPVTGRFMEYMFRDDEAPATPLGAITKSADSTGGPIAGPAIQEMRSSGASGIDQAPAKTSNRIATEPVTHWGSRKGLILGASVCDASGERRDLILWGQDVTIVIDAEIPPDIPREHLGIAFSIKDLKGTDLIVSTTQNYCSIELTDHGHVRATFRMTNSLVGGKYLLVAAVESRQLRDVHYYEYIEGAHYFACLSEPPFFGLFQPTITQTLEIVR
jgi:lipopolysaccharide transport system ATP-binding protein